MQKIETVPEMRSHAAQLKQAGKTIALVVASGPLHAGHEALIALARARAEIVVVTLFMNPLALGPSENLSRTPRTPEADAARCAELRVDVLFAPAAEAMFPRGYSTYVGEETVSKPLCGISRPTYFRGVTTGMAKLLNLIRPGVVVMGQRDAQQIAVVRKMIADLGFDVEIAVAPIVREPDGLAVMGRNRDLTNAQRADAVWLHHALVRAQEMVAQGVRSTDRVIAEVTHLLGERRRLRIIYVAMVDPVTMETVRELVPGKTLLAVAAWVDEVRLMDNALL